MARHTTSGEDSILAALSSSVSDIVERLDGAIEDALNDVARLNDQLAERENINSDLQSLLEKSQGQVESLTHELEAAQNALAQAEAEIKELRAALTVDPKDVP